MEYISLPLYCDTNSVFTAPVIALSKLNLSEIKTVDSMALNDNSISMTTIYIKLTISMNGSF